MGWQLKQARARRNACTFYFIFLITWPDLLDQTNQTQAKCFGMEERRKTTSNELNALLIVQYTLCYQERTKWSLWDEAGAPTSAQQLLLLNAAFRFKCTKIGLTVEPCGASCQLLGLPYVHFSVGWSVWWCSLVIQVDKYWSAEHFQ